MTLSFNYNEEMRLRMADLENKLAESEDERCKLEKTCNVLMRAFREEEKIRYKTLNKNYEKFLQDCTMRKRRNNIILKSLCRIEDRSRALFAKTERLKLLKDRYISYLKISDIKDGISSHTWTTLPPSSSSQKISNEVTPKLIQWKNPLTTDSKVADLEGVEENSLWNYKTPDAVSRNLDASRGKYNQKQIANEIVQDSCDDEPSRTQESARSLDAQNKLYLVNTRLRSPSEHPLDVSVEKMIGTINQEKPVNHAILKNNDSNKLEVKGLMEIAVSREKNNLSHQEPIEKLKKALSFEGEIFDNVNTDERHDPCDKIFEKDDIEQNEKNLVKKQNNSHHVSVPRINHYLATSSSNICEEEGGDYPGDNVRLEMKTGSPEENLPKGLDGVDYQNETYPESYYEQPVHHHNHSSIIADVILEEDETEQDADEEVKNSFDEVQLLPEDQKNNKTELTELMDKVLDIKEEAIDEVKSHEKLSVGKSNDSSEKSEKLAEENLEKKRNVRSNLIHLLESDSESFQIEHGDANSGNEDSDFDFSFH